MVTSVKVVMFDHGGVLSRGGEKGTNEKAASRAMGLDSVIDIPDLNQALKVGRISNEQYIAEINQRFPNAPVPLTMSMWGEIYETLAFDSLSYEFVQRCRAAGLQTGILSSINPAMAEALKADGTYDGFSPLVLSCYVGCAKPDPAIYALVEQELPGIQPYEILFLDDQEKCVMGARQRGWRAIQVVSPEQMIQEASRLLGLC
jgi:putative hydrolase of the HAD superfamily